MKLVDLQFERLKIQLKTPFKVAFGEISHSDNVLVRAVTDDGVTGWGEAAPLPFVTGETGDSVMAALAAMKPALLGCDPFAIDHIHGIMSGILHGNRSAVCAVDLAMYDIMGKATGKPVYRLLGGQDGTVQSDVTIGIAPPEEMARAAAYYTQELGYRILKVKAGIDPAADVEALTLIRRAVGDRVRLRVDANQGWSPATALWALDRLEPLGVEAVEQCLPDWDLEGAAFVRSKARGVRLMLDESIHSPRDAARACKLGAADVLNIKLMKSGGIYPALQIAAVAEAFGLECMVGCMLESPLAITAGLSLVAARSVITEADCDSFMLYDGAATGVTGGFAVDGDIMRLSDQPGLGVGVHT